MRSAWSGIAAAAALGTLMACGGGGDAPPATDVTGSRLVRYFQDDGSVQSVPVAGTAQASIAALLPDGAGGYRVVAGAFSAEGAFSIPDVGATGTYFLRLTPATGSPRFYFWEETSRQVDLGRDSVGRSARTTATLSTPVTFATSGLAPWMDRDGLALFSTGDRLNTMAFGAPGTGATTGDFLCDFSGLPLPVAGDLGWLLQTEQTAVGADAAPVRTVVRSAALTIDASLRDGQALTLPLPLSAPPQGLVALDIRRSQYAALLPAVAPNLGATLGTFMVDVRAVPRSVGVYPTSVSLLTASLPPGSHDVDLGTLQYGRPFPSWFGEVSEVQWWITPQLPGLTSPVSFIASRIDAVPAAPATISPGVGPPSLPLVAGRDATQAQAGVGLTPRLEWSAPSLGAPTRYTADIYELPATGGAAARAWFSVLGASVTIPPGVLEAGKTYFAAIWAIREPAWNPAAPTRLTVPREMVPVITSPFTP